MSVALAPSPVFQGLGFGGIPLPGGKLFTYVAGTSTPQATYIDSTQTTPNSNPVILNSNGQANVWFVIGQTYKVVLQDAFSNQIYSVDQIPGGATASQIIAVLTQQVLGGILYPVTPAETAAGITVGVLPGSIVNSFYPPGNVDRYGTNSIPGTTSMAAAFQAAINQCKIGAGVDVIVGSTGPYLIDAALDLTTPSGTGATRYAVTMRGVRNVQAVTNNSPYFGTILLKHTGIAFDNTGATGVNFENLSIGTDPTTYPKIGFLLARNADASSAPDVRFRNVEVLGNFHIAPLYNYGIEDDEYYGCQFWNFAQDTQNGANNNTGSRACIFTGTNYLYGITSTFTTILGSGSNHSISCQDHKFFGGTYYSNRGSPNLSSVVITGTAGQFSCTSAALAVGQSIAITGTFGGTGSISGYTNPTVYFISATNGSTTFTLVTAAGGAIITTAGTPSGLTYAAQTSDVFYLESIQNFKMYGPWALSGQVGVNPGRSFLYVDTKNGPTSIVAIRDLMLENQAPDAQNFGIFFGNEGAAGSAQNAQWQYSGGQLSANIAAVYNSSASAWSSVDWSSPATISTPNSLINDGTISSIRADSSLAQSAGAGTLSRNIYSFAYPVMIQSPGDGYLSLQDSSASANAKIWNLRSTAGSFALTLASDANANTTTVWQITRTGTTLNQMSLQCPLGVNGNTGPAQSTGWGTPIGGTAISSYNITDAGGANSNTNKALAQVIATLKAFGLFGT